MYRFRGVLSHIQQPEIITPTRDLAWPGAIGAFLGAFFAFTFGLIAFYLQKKFEMYWKHKTAVVEIEHILNDHLDVSATNQFLLQGAINTLKRHNITYTLLNQFRLPDDIDLRFGDLELANAYLNYKGSVIRLNHGMNTWQGLNERLQQTVIANPNTPPPIVHKNMEIIREKAEELFKFLLGLDEDTIKFLAFIRVYLKKDKHIWTIWLLRKEKKEVVTKEEIDKELETLNGEVAEISKESRERIAKIMKS